MLRSIHLRDFKSFANEQVRLSPLTVLVGANASGKSNLLDAIRVVQGLGLGFSLAETLQGRMEAGREVWKGIRGGAAEVIRGGGESAGLSTEWELKDQVFGHTLSFSVKPQAFIREEGLSRTTFEGETATTQILDIEIPPGVEHENTQSLLSALELGLKENTETFRIVLALRHALQQVVMLNLSPERMRDYAPKHALEMGTEGEALSAVVWSRSRTEDERWEWVDWLSEFCSPEITDLDFIETLLGDVMLVLVEKDGTRTSARALSDGTLRFLGTLVTLRTAPRGSIFLWEELEMGLHPQRIHLLVEFLESVTRERGIQVITTTHSPQVLQALSSEALNNAVLCARVPSQPGTVLRRFEDIPHFKEVIDKAGIDHRFATGWLERAL